MKPSKLFKPQELARLEFGPRRSLSFVWDARSKTLVAEIRARNHNSDDTGWLWVVESQTALNGLPLEDFVVGILRVHSDIRPRPQDLHERKSEVLG
jgi:hypothetical protein